jgi:hypothetical protein
MSIHFRQPPLAIIQPRRILSRRNTGATRVCRRGTSPIGRDTSMGALYRKQIRFEVIPSPETLQEPICNLRHMNDYCTR